ncbi:MAG TPA: carboxypeptidase-like regulatory domain-containing protein [Candidatus Paceibacterota bacterium]|nr:carboxypeptidase-like regulatory domain-containing protein [Candidatus Paceibacterota bacterium]
MTLKRFFPVFVFLLFIFAGNTFAATTPETGNFTVTVSVSKKSSDGGGVMPNNPNLNPNVIPVVPPEENIITGEISCTTEEGGVCPGFLPPEEITPGQQITEIAEEVIPVAPIVPETVIDLTEPPAEVISDVVDTINNIVENTVDNVTQFSNDVLDNITEFSNNIAEGAAEYSVAVLDAVQNFVKDPVAGAVNISVKITEATRDFVESPTGKVITGVAKPLGVAAGATFVAVQTVVGTGMATVTSLSDIYLMLWKLVGILVGSSKRRGRPWGTVYDSVTKRPLDPAYVVASRITGEEVADAITDLDGRYGFFIPAGTYKLRADKTNYSFPSKKMEGKNSDEIYNNIYHGEELTAGEGEVLVENIPLDPIGFDWNEFAKNKQNLFRIYSKRERFWSRIFDGIYFAGLLSAFIATLFDPRIINFIFIAIYALFIIHGMRKKGRKKAVSVKSAASSLPIPFAIIKVFFADMNNLTKVAVADHLGRFYFLVGPGRYYITVDEKQADGTYKTIYKSATMDLKHGILDKDILV